MSLPCLFKIGEFLLTRLVSYIVIEVERTPPKGSNGRRFGEPKGPRNVSGTPNLYLGSTRPGQRMPNDRNGNLLLESELAKEFVPNSVLMRGVSTG
eukprot:825332-Amphidinium_carterae.1